MTKREAIECLASGHAIWLVKTAKEVCRAVGLELPDSLIIRWKGQKDANPTNHFKGIFLKEDKPGEGVGADSLSSWVAYKLGVEVESYHGRGRQSRANAEAISKKLGIG